MANLSEVVEIRRAYRRDSRGWLLKVIDGSERGLPSRECEVYLTLAHAGQSRGGHYHRAASEWFTLVIGQAELLLADVGTGERRTIRVVAADPVTIYVPPGVAHAFRNTSSDEEMLLIAFSDRSYDPADTLAYALGEGTAR